MVNIPSPTGEEAALAEYLSGQLNAHDVSANTQKIDDTQSNAFGRFNEHSDGKTLMLYAPIDTVTSNNEAEDLPWLGPKMRHDFRAEAYVKEGPVSYTHLTLPTICSV